MKNVGALETYNVGSVVEAHEVGDVWYVVESHEFVDVEYVGRFVFTVALQGFWNSIVICFP